MTEAQHLAADPRASAFVRANAGSGKTETLISRTARLLLARVDPAAILCVTYTKAAAAEMQRRLFRRLGDWAVAKDAALRQTLAELEGGAPDSFSPQDLRTARTLFARALETPGGLKIQTIHAFCERLLRRFPLEAGVSPGFEVADDALAASLTEAARAGVAEAVRAGKSQALTDAYARFSVALDPFAFEAMFATFEAQRSAISRWLGRFDSPAAVMAAVLGLCGLDRLENAEDIEDAAVLPPALVPSRWLAAARALAAGTEKSDQPNGLAFQAVAEAALAGEQRLETVRGLFFTSKGPRARLATQAVDAEVREWLAEEQARLGAAFERARACRIAEDTVWALMLAGVYAAEYAKAKTARGVLDFADLVEKTCQLLRSAPAAAWVLYKLDGGIDHILLDEAQDTAPDQWKIIEGLTGEFFSGAGRPADRPVERSLFIVGDRKQSIYSFQGAAPDQLESETVSHLARIRAGGGAAHDVELIHSWRSAAQVLGFVDKVFAPADLLAAIQGEGGKALEHVARRAGPGCVDLWEPEQEFPAEDREAWDAPLDLEATTSANRRLARKIAGEIKSIVARGDAVFDKGLKADRPAGYGDVLILVRRRGVLFEDILRELKKVGVPVAGADRLALSAHIAFDDLLAVARFALYPRDDLTLAALLKSPFCGLDDEALYELALGRGDQALWDRLIAHAGERRDWNAALGFLRGVLDEAAIRRPFELYSRLLARLDGQGRSGRRLMLERLGLEASDAIDEFLAQVLAAEQRGVRDLEGLAAALARLDITVKREMDEARGEVRVMTAHGAKGLEAPIVFLPEMTLNQAPRGGPLLKTPDGGFLWCSSSGDDCAASAAARDLRKRREEEERLRLFYVALTRARDRLVLCGRIAARTDRAKVGGWYAAAEAALKALTGDDGAAMRNEGGVDFRRYGEDPAALGAAPVSTEEKTALPAWLQSPPAPEKAGLRYVSPSALGEGAQDLAASPLAGQGGLGRFRRGALIHRLLQLLPDIELQAREGAAERLLAREADLTGDERTEMAAAAFGVLHDAQFEAVFGPGSRAEVAIAGAAAALPPGMSVSGQIDRLVVSADRVLVVDFKTNRPAPARIEDADPAYIRQMAAYVATLREAFPGRAVEAALVWTDGPRLMAVPEFLILGSLAELNRAP